MARRGRFRGSRFLISFVGRLFAIDFQRYVFHIEVYPNSGKANSAVQRLTDFFQGVETVEVMECMNMAVIFLKSVQVYSRASLS